MTELCEQRSQGWNNFLSNSEKTDFPVKRAAGAFVLFIDSNPSFVALNLAEDTAQLSINSSNRPCDTSIICSAPAHFGLFPPTFLFQKHSITFQSTMSGTFCICRGDYTRYLPSETKCINHVEEITPRNPTADDRCTESSVRLTRSAGWDSRPRLHTLLHQPTRETSSRAAEGYLWPCDQRPLWTPWLCAANSGSVRTEVVWLTADSGLVQVSGYHGDC